MISVFVVVVVVVVVVWFLLFDCGVTHVLCTQIFETSVMILVCHV